MDPSQIASCARQIDELIEQFPAGDQVAILASALARRIEGMPDEPSSYQALLLALAGISTIRPPT